VGGGSEGAAPPVAATTPKTSSSSISGRAAAGCGGHSQWCTGVPKPPQLLQRLCKQLAM
jgi:hypothetical protein